MNGFALLWGKILDSSLWVKESKETRLVWITMLAMKNADGVIQASLVGLADRAKVTVDECRTALAVFLAPDPDDTSKVEDGRRIREIPGGWQIINHDLYRFSTEAKREFWRLSKAEQRSRKGPGRKRSIRERVKEQVQEDPLVRQDSKELRRLKSNGRVAKKVGLEYDLPEGDVAGAGAPAAGGGPGDAGGSPDVRGSGVELPGAEAPPEVVSGIPADVPSPADPGALCKEVVFAPLPLQEIPSPVKPKFPAHPNRKLPFSL